MRSLRLLLQSSKSLLPAVLLGVAFSTNAVAETLATGTGIDPDQVQRAGIGSDSVPGVFAILALSIAAITILRRRARQ